MKARRSHIILLMPFHSNEFGGLILRTVPYASGRLVLFALVRVPFLVYSIELVFHCPSILVLFRFSKRASPYRLASSSISLVTETEYSLLVLCSRLLTPSLQRFSEWEVRIDKGEVQHYFVLDLNAQKRSAHGALCWQQEMKPRQSLQHDFGMWLINADYRHASAIHIRWQPPMAFVNNIMAFFVYAALQARKQSLDCPEAGDERHELVTSLAWPSKSIASTDQRHPASTKRDKSTPSHKSPHA